MKKYEKYIYYTDYYSPYVPMGWRFTDIEKENKLGFMNLNNNIKMKKFDTYFKVDMLIKDLQGIVIVKKISIPTTINVCVCPKELPDIFLIEEYKQIKRIINIIIKKKVDYNKIVDRFTDNLHNVRFFCDKMMYIKVRYEKVYNEMLIRNIIKNDYIELFNVIPNKLMNEYIETKNDRAAIIRVITNRGFVLNTIQ